jgi:GDPmannose 4,6-dehydratase
MLLTINPQAGECYNIGGTYTCTVGQVLDSLLVKSSRSDISVEVDADRLRPIDADLQVPDTRKFTAHTGWEPQYQYDQTMSDLLTYWRERVARGSRFLSR